MHSDYEYINENEIDDELKCIICKQPFESPVSISICNHTFCEECIKKWLIRKPTCPTCRQVTTSRFGRSNQSSEVPPYVPINTQIVRNQLDRLLVRCLICNETNIQRSHWKHHEKVCLKRIISCPSSDIKCTWEGSRDTLLIHLNSCTFQQVRPIIDELKTELNLTKKKHTNLENSILLLERKVSFLLKFINHGNIMSQNCTKSSNECNYNRTHKSNRNHRFLCSVCKEYIPREKISLHACSGDCICCSCVKSQYSNQIQTWEQCSDPTESD